MFGEWKGDLGREPMTIHENEVEVQSKKLTATEALKKKMKEQEERQTQGGSSQDNNCQLGKKINI